MERRAWIAERRAWIIEQYTVGAPTWDARISPITPTHRRFVARVIDAMPPGGTVLDAACGTGRYFEFVLDAGRRVHGIDQSAGMLAEAHARHPEVELERIGLQELVFEDAFDAAMCIDAMEYVSPEDWPVVLRNLRRAVRRQGLVYLTVEEIDRAEVERVLADASADGLPVVPGEHIRRGGGYHFYPTRDRVAAWLAGAGLALVDEATSHGPTYAYWHLLLRS